MTYISFGFFQPLFLAALAAGTVLVETSVRAARGELSARQARAPLLVLAVSAAVLLPFAGALAAGLFRGVGYVLGRTSEVSGSSGYVSYPRDWLKGIFEARPLFADGPGLAWKQLSAAFFLSPIAAAAWLLRGARGDRPGLHFGLAVWAAVTLLLAISQRLNVYYAALLAAAVLVEAAKLVHARLRGGSLSRIAPAVAAAAVLLLALPMASGLAEELRAVRVPGRDLFATLEWMRRNLPHEIDAYDPRLLDAGAPPGLFRRGGRPRTVVARTPDPLRRGAPGRREQLRVRVSRFDPVLSRRHRGGGAFHRAAAEGALGRRHRSRSEDERLRGLPRKAGPPDRLGGEAGLPDARVFLYDAVPPLRFRRRGGAPAGRRRPAAHLLPPRLPFGERDPPRRPLAREVEGLRDRREGRGGSR